MNYSKMSNKEINMEIAKRMPFNSSSIISYVENSDAVHVDAIVSQFTVDYCGSWGDAGELMQSMGKLGGFGVLHSERLTIFRCGDKSYTDENLLRAAAIVWLMVDDEKNQ